MSSPISDVSIDERRDHRILQQLRYGRVFSHWQRQRHTQFTYRWQIPPTLPLPLAAPEHIQDCCNKTVPMYWSLPSSLAKPGPGSLFNYVHFRWVDPWRSNVEFGNFIAKSIRIKADASCLDEVDVLQIHRSILHQIDHFEPSRHPESNFTLAMYDDMQTEHYRVKPTFRALLLVVDYIVHDVTGFNPVLSQARLIRTGEEAALSAPNDFASIRQHADGYEGQRIKSVALSLETAVDFILALERREAEALGEDTSSEAMDFHIGTLEQVNSQARKRGYTGPALETPSTTWIKGNPFMRHIQYESNGCAPVDEASKFVTLAQVESGEAKLICENHSLL